MLIDMCCVLGRHTAQNMCAAISDTLNSFKVKEKVFAVTADRASAQQKTVKLLNGGEVTSVWCAAHRIHLAVRDAFKVSLFLGLSALLFFLRPKSCLVFRPKKVLLRF